MGRDETGQLRDRVGKVARRATEGALVAVDIASRSHGALPRDEADVVLARVLSNLHAVVPAATWVRTAWTRHESVWVGSPAELSELARAAVARLSACPLAWILTLTQANPNGRCAVTRTTKWSS